MHKGKMDAKEVSREVLKQFAVSIVRFVLDVAFNKFIEWKLTDGGAVSTKLYQLLRDTNRNAEPQINNSCSLLREGLRLIQLDVDQNLAAPGLLTDEALAQHVEMQSQRSVRSHDRRANVEYCFKRSENIARKAFFKPTVIKERVMACKLRVAAKLLESGLQDPEAATTSCLQYIEELHDLREIQEMFSFLLEGAGSLATRFMGNEPLDIALSVLSINHQVFHFAVCRSQVYPFLFNWEQISLNDRKFHPILDVHEVLKKAPESEESKSLYRTILSLRTSFAVRNPNEIIKLGDENLEVIIKTDKVENISVAFPEGNPVEKQRHALTIDDTTEQNAYVVRKVKKQDKLNTLDFKEIFMLYVFRQDNVIETLTELDFIPANDCEYINIALHKRRLNLIALKDNQFYSFDKKGEMASKDNSKADSNWQTAFDFYHEQQYD